MHAMSEVAIERVYVTDDTNKKTRVENMKTIQTPIGVTVSVGLMIIRT
jgi:hypothetical protein